MPQIQIMVIELKGISVGLEPDERTKVENVIQEVAHRGGYEKIVVDATHCKLPRHDLVHFQNCMNFWFRNSPTRIEYLPGQMSTFLRKLNTNMYKNVAFL